VSDGLHAWIERREHRAMRVLPLGLLAMSVGLDVLVDGVDPVNLALAAALAVALALLWPRAARRRGAWAVALLAVQLGLSAALVLRDPVYGFFAWSGYVSVALLPRRAVPAGVLATALVTALSQVGGAPDDGSGWAVYLVVWLANAGVAGTVIALAIVQRDQRERLEAALRENAGLHAQLLAQAREAGALDERTRLAREIHDTLAQGLIGIITQLEAAAQDDRDRHLDAAARLARESLNEARRSVQALRPQPLEDARLPEALAQVAGAWSDLHRVPAEALTTGEPRPLPTDVEATLLRTAQEALANVSKHASASRVGLTLSYMDDLVTLDIRDDGVGGAAPGNGYGLTGMRERLQGLNGTLAIESEAGAGTALSASVPLPRARHAAPRYGALPTEPSSPLRS
jgi:signal transduction histidine kinase